MRGSSSVRERPWARRRRLALLGVLALPVLTTLACGSGDEPDPASEPAARDLGRLTFDESDRPPLRASRSHPNIILAVTDDQSRDSIEAMPTTRRIVGEGGATFTRAFVAYPLCCPSRVTALTGQHAHNHGAQGNRPFGDGGGYVNLRAPNRVLPAWLRDRGYVTVHLGKWANTPGPEVPAGWDWWGFTRNSTTGYYNYDLRTPDGGHVRFGERDRDYHTDVITRMARRFIRAHRSGSERPFLLSLAFLAPHDGSGRDDPAGRRCRGHDGKGTAQPAARDADAFEDAAAPRAPSFNAEDLSGKPAYVRDFDLLTDEQIERIDRDFGCELAALQSVDRGIGSLWRLLRREGIAEQTVIVFTTDHGTFRGEHRRAGGKNLPYEEAIRVPLLIRGPGVAAGERHRELVSNVDLAPTIVELAEVEPPEGTRRPQDGRSMVPLLVGEGGWPARALLVEGRQQTIEREDGRFVAFSYQGLRTERYTYTEYFEKDTVNARRGGQARIGEGGHVFTELYELGADPHQLTNLAGDPDQAGVERTLATVLDRLRDCEGDACRAAERLGPSELSVLRAPEAVPARGAD